MKSILIALVIILFTNSCVSINKDYLINDVICNYNDSIFYASKDELKIDLNILKQEKNNDGDIVITENKVYKNLYYTLSSNSIWNRQINKPLRIVKSIKYRKNGTIEFCTIYFNGKSKIFNETYYDEQGNITKVIDYEKGYTICWAEAIEIVKKIAKRDIEKYEVTGFNLKHTNLNKFPNVKPEWVISLNGNEEYQRKPYKFTI